jgi:hypothetical protein
MASGNYYKAVGTTNPQTDWTAGVVLSLDEDGNPDLVVGVGGVYQLTAEQKSEVESYGLVLEKSSASEAEEFQQKNAVSGPVPADTGAQVSTGTTADSTDQSNSK